MNKKIITFLISLMGISILGIIIIQLVWMNNAIRVRNEMFDRSVNEALNSTTNRLETMQDYRLINRFAFNDSIHTPFNSPSPPPPPPGIIRHTPIRPKNLRAKQVERIVKSGQKRNWIEYQISTKSNNQPSGREENYVFINSDSLSRNLDSIYAHGINKFDSLAEHIQEWKDSSGIRHRIEIKSKNLKRVASQVVQEISTWEEDVPLVRVNEVLKKELENRNIPIPFETGIIRDSIFSEK